MRGSTTQAVLARGWISSEHVVPAGRVGVGTLVLTCGEEVLTRRRVQDEDVTRSKGNVLEYSFMKPYFLKADEYPTRRACRSTR